MRGACAVAAVLVLTLAPASRAQPEDAATADTAPLIEERLAAVAETAELVDTELADRRARLAARLRAYYKLSRAARPRLALDRRARASTLRLRGAARRILRRELRELALVEAEREATAAARARLRAEQQRVAVPAPGSLRRPIAGAPVAAPFGTERDRRTGAHVVRQGVELVADVGSDVRAPDAGEVVYAGEMRGLGAGIVIDHGEFHTVLGRLRALERAVGDRVERGDIVGEVAGTRLHLQVRTSLSPLDPTPLLGP